MPVQSPPPQEYARIVLIIVLLFFLYTSPDNGVSPGGFANPRDYFAERLSRSRWNLNILNTTRWGDFAPRTEIGNEEGRYLNLTGFKREDGYNWDRLDVWKDRCRVFAEEVRKERSDVENVRESEMEGSALTGRVYENVTGVVTGRWARYEKDLNESQMRGSLNLSEISPGIDWAFREQEFWTRNVTGKEGKLMLRVDERDGVQIDDIKEKKVSDQQPVRDIAATMTVQDESSSGDGWEMRMHGVHWPKQGMLLMTTTSDKFAGIFGLPHMTIRQDFFTTSQKVLNVSIEKTVEELENSIWTDISNPWTSSPDAQGDATMPVPHCEYVVFAQVYPIQLRISEHWSNIDATTMVHQIEEEMRFPNGAPIPGVPRLQMSAVIFSPDCGFILESEGPPDFSPADGVHLVGRKQEEYLSDVHYWLLVFAVVIFSQILLLKIQSKEASTPSTIGRVSLYTIGMMLMTDALLFSTLSLLNVAAPNIFPSALLASFASLMSVALEVPFIRAIYNVQEPERRPAQVTRTANTPPRPTPISTPAPIITAAGADTAPILPTTASRPTASNNVPIIIPSDQDIDAEIAENVQATSTVPLPTRASLLPTTNPAATQPPPRSTSFGAIYIQSVIGITLVMFLSLSATTWPIPLRTAYVHLMSFLYLSFWVPQIRRNIKRNCRKALLWKFVIGQSILRLLPFAYFYLRADNIIFADSDWIAFTVLAGWVWIQVWILIAQEILGPRWGLPKGWTEEAWDYHPILKEDNVEAGGLPIGLVQIPASPGHERSSSSASDDLGSSKKNDDGKRSVDCAICMQTLEVPVAAAGSDAASSGGVVGMLARRQYMVTPCRHVFHSPCLEGWMRFRLQCPICRENLPPL